MQVYVCICACVCVCVYACMHVCLQFVSHCQSPGTTFWHLAKLMQRLMGALLIGKRIVIQPHQTLHRHYIGIT